VGGDVFHFRLRETTIEYAQSGGKDPRLLITTTGDDHRGAGMTGKCANLIPMVNQGSEGFVIPLIAANDDPASLGA